MEMVEPLEGPIWGVLGLNHSEKCPGMGPKQAKVVSLGGLHKAVYPAGRD